MSGTGVSHRRQMSRRRTWRCFDDPLQIESLRMGFGFLLIVRTERIVTVRTQRHDVPRVRTSTVGYSDIPAYSQVL